jgi:hypothetical protein
MLMHYATIIVAIYKDVNRKSIIGSGDGSVGEEQKNAANMPAD